MAVNDRNEIFEQDPQEVKCPDCGSHNLDPFDGIYYDDEVLLGFRYQCNDCGSQFYSDDDMTEEDVGYMDDTCCPKCESSNVVYKGGDNVVNVSGPVMSRVDFYECYDCGHKFSN